VHFLVSKLKINRFVL